MPARKTSSKQSSGPFAKLSNFLPGKPTRHPKVYALLVLSVLFIAGGVYFVGRSYAASIDPNTWAPTVPGVYFFDRSNQSGNATADFTNRENQFGRKFDGHLYYLPANVTSADLTDAHWSLTTDK